MIRVVFMITELRPAGAERVVFELATRLDRKRFEPTVLALWSRGGEDGSFASDLRARGVPTELLRVGSKLDVTRVPALVGFLRHLRPHVLNGHLFHANLVARLVAPLVGGPRVIGTHHVVERRSLGPRFFLDRFTAWRDDRTVAVSQAVARFALSVCGARAERLVVIPNGIDLEAFGRLPDGQEARAALGLPAAGLLVGAIGRLDVQKGHQDLLRGWPAVLARHPTAHLAIAGEGPLRSELERTMRELGIDRSVTLAGHQRDVPRFLAASDVFVMPSRWEGFGLALVEALAAGKPCIASSADSLPEVLGDAGVLVPPEDPRALGQALGDLLASESERARLAGAAVLRAQLFSVERMVKSYEDLYETLAGNPPPAPIV